MLTNYDTICLVIRVCTCMYCRNVESFSLSSKDEQRVARRMSRGTSTRPEIQRLRNADAEAKLQLALYVIRLHAQVPA
jgi:hypothetical protein